MDKIDYYEVLQIPKTANRDDIKRAHRKLALRYHPDKNKSDSAKEKFRSIQKAYEVLIDDTKRQHFDRVHRQRTAPVDPQILLERELTKIRDYNKKLLERENAKRQRLTRESSRQQSSSRNDNSSHRFHGQIMMDKSDDEYEKFVLDRLRSIR